MIQHLLNLFYPKACAGCDSLLLSGESVICTHCRHNIPLTNHHLDPENEAYRKFYGKIPVELVITFMYFHKKGIVQKLVHNLKYKGHEEIGSCIGNWFSDDLLKLPEVESIDEIIPVPLHPKRLRQRGYNQVTTFGMALSEHLKIPLNNGILKRKVYSKTQVKKNLLKRSELNNQSIFDVDFTEKYYGKHFLLIDDVLTTGSTLEACGRALLKIPNAKITIVCMAMSH